jgi:hypothetical protein
LYILDINPLFNEWLTKTSFHCASCFIILVIVSFSEQKLYILIQSCSYFPST